MRSRIRRAVLAAPALLVACGLVFSRTPPAVPAQEGAAEAPEPSDATASRSRAELEREFAATMSHATLAGKWRLTKDGEIGDERSDSYTLGEVRKLDSGAWLMQARIQYGERDFTVPVKVDVEWAGDTPVIQVTDWGVPALGVGPYTARVMVYRGLYSGAWFGKGYGGLMSGRVEKRAEKPETASGE